MSQPLPTGNFQWLMDEEIENLNVENLDDESEEGNNHNKNKNKGFIAKSIVILLLLYIEKLLLFLF